MRRVGGWTHYGFVAGAILLAAASAGCAKKPQHQDAQRLAGRADASAEPGSPRDFSVNVGDRVHFMTDSAELNADARVVLNGQAQWLHNYPSYNITVEGHSDERGTREYNLALAARRSNAVKTYLAAKGIGQQRLRTISFGKERPVALCDALVCWSQNRRAVSKVAY